jgi:signal transduction histidine kinase
MFASLRSRLFFTYLLISGLILGIVGVSLVVFLLRNPVVEGLTYRRLEAGFNLLPRRENAQLDRLSPDEAGRVLERLDALSGVRIVFLSDEGHVVADSRPQAPAFPASVAQDIISIGERTQSRYRDESGSWWLYEARPVGQGHYLVNIAPRPSVRSVALWGSDLLKPLLQAAGIALILAIILSWLMARWVSAPLNQMADASQAVASGRYDLELQPGGPREVVSLAQAFNEMVRQVEASQRAQQDFIANVSHDLKTPLTSIQGFAGAILDGTAEDVVTQQHAAQVIHDESERLSRMVDELLELARLDAGQIAFKRGRVLITALLETVVERQAIRAEEAGVLVTTSIPVLPDLIGDGDRLAQVFTNLLDNAIKHTPEGGKVKLWAEANEGWVSIHVDDSGPSIPPEELTRIFERFYQVDKARPGGSRRGVGLGLAISREIVRGHHGRIVAQSTEGVGSRFTVQLPVVRPDDKTLAINQPV